MTTEIDQILDRKIKPAGSAQAEAEDDVPAVEARAITVPGQLWLMGNHKLYCGDALEEESYVQLLGNEKAQMGATDVPFNVKINGHVSGLGKVKHREFAMASGEMSEEEYIRFLTTVYTLMGCCHLWMAPALQGVN